MRARPGDDASVDVLLLTGAPGAGKSSVLDALSTRLETEGIRHGAIESEQLTRGFPSLGNELLAEQLAAVLATQREAGRKLFLIAFTPETAEQLRDVRRASAATRELVVCLAAPPETVAARLQAREPDRWPGKAGLIARARELAGSVPKLESTDLVLATGGRDADAVAGEVRAAMRARGIA